METQEQGRHDVHNIIPSDILRSLREQVSTIYGSPLDECVIVTTERERHLDTCDDGPECPHHDAEYDIVTISYLGTERGDTNGPKVRRWHSTWGRKVTQDNRAPFELYAD